MHVESQFNVLPAVSTGRLKETLLLQVVYVCNYAGTFLQFATLIC